MFFFPLGGMHFFLGGTSEKMLTLRLPDLRQMDKVGEDPSWNITWEWQPEPLQRGARPSLGLWDPFQMAIRGKKHGGDP